MQRIFRHPHDFTATVVTSWQHSAHRFRISFAPALPPPSHQQPPPLSAQQAPVQGSGQRLHGFRATKAWFRSRYAQCGLHSSSCCFPPSAVLVAAASLELFRLGRATSPAAWCISGCLDVCVRAKRTEHCSGHHQMDLSTAAAVLRQVLCTAPLSTILHA